MRLLRARTKELLAKLGDLRGLTCAEQENEPAGRAARWFRAACARPASSGLGRLPTTLRGHPAV